ncbi:hypothetical protein JXA47_17165 [Candidatus Sumerlaeota bacterium]|nr:hypothetical protein [Candidatus Sumerlaeota bacterium]
MSETTDFHDGVVKAALEELRADPIPLHTFALYHDHESAAVSVCADIRESSTKGVHSQNRFMMKYFPEHIREGE